MRQMREKIQVKLNSMASILIDDIIVPDEPTQSGQESIVASFFDKDGNKFTFNLSLTVTPKEIEEVEPTPTLSDQVAIILEKLTALEEDVSNLKNYHLASPEEPEGDNNEEGDSS